MGKYSKCPPEVQTDKAKTKVVPCVAPEGADICGQPLVVNTFYAPARARCSRHRDAPAAVTTPSRPAPGADPVPAPARRIPPVVESLLPRAPLENHSLEELVCPFGHEPMTILRIDPKMGFVTFKCNACKTAVEVMPAWSPLLIRDIPADLRPVVARYNEEVIARGASFVQSERYLYSQWTRTGGD